MRQVYRSSLVELYHADCFEWVRSELERRNGQPWIHAIVTESTVRFGGVHAIAIGKDGGGERRRMADSTEL